MDQNYALIVERNNKSLERFKRNQQRQINTLRAQLSAQQAMVEQNIKQMQSIVEARLATIKRIHENRQMMFRKM